MKKPKTKTVVAFEDTDAEVYNALEIDDYLKELAIKIRDIRFLLRGITPSECSVFVQKAVLKTEKELNKLADELVGK